MLEPDSASEGRSEDFADGSLESHPPLAVGASLAPRYEVAEHLHRSNDYDVYEVYSQERACSCIAKVPRPDRIAERKVRRALLREGDLLYNLRHPHIARAYETFDEPRPTVILETLTGETLAYLIDESPRRMATGDICQMGLHLCSALHYLHGQGLLHLDLKPSNIVSERGAAKILDLSLARPPGYGRPGVGTSQYMSAEQAAGGYLGAAADVWGLGAVLFETATGEIPFDAPEDASETGEYEQLMRSAEPVRAYRRVPGEFDALVSACLSQDLSLRPDLPEVMDALETLAR